MLMEHLDDKLIARYFAHMRLTRCVDFFQQAARQPHRKSDIFIFRIGRPFRRNFAAAVDHPQGGVVDIALNTGLFG